MRTIIKLSLLGLMLVMSACNSKQLEFTDKQLFIIRANDTYSLLENQLDDQMSDYYHGADEWWDQYFVKQPPDFIEEIDIRNFGLDNFVLFFSKSGELCHVLGSVMIEMDDKERADKVLKQFTEYFSLNYGSPVKNIYNNNSWIYNDIKISVIPSSDIEFNDVIVEFWLKNFNKCYRFIK